ncbi:hypothetical protein [Candidatus Nitrososphaera sp. FF02]|uniref:hypothetical protein n=1 Tax=Candidatus Nitrososphaera sp. FF02 TaxID=3398226 RepID=UPI0039EB8B0C
MRAHVLALAALAILVAASAQNAYAHFEHFAHYNARGDSVGPYFAYQELDPDYARPGEPTAVMFSVQDREGRDTYDIVTMVEVYSGHTGERIAAFPWTRQDVGDFSLTYTFPDLGSYQLVLSVATGDVNVNQVDPPRATLSSTLNCECDRAIYNVSISNNFGAIWSATIAVAVFVPLSIIGIVLGLVYKKKRKQLHANSSEEFVKWCIMLLAIAGGLVHFAVYSGHASLRIEYSIFLIVAGGMQVTYGFMYILITMAGADLKTTLRQYYRKTVAVNLFGLLGTGVLLGLYAYAVTFPPPLSPNNVPEDIDFAGILAKAVEAVLVVGILYLMRIEKRRFAGQLARTQ